jgi:hypothetical protein
VSSADLAGGIAGELVGATLSDSYSSTVVAATSGHAGLLAGGMSSGASIINCYSSGTLPNQIGVLVSDRAASFVSASFFDCTVASCSTDDVSGVATLDLEVAGRYVYAGWDFVHTWGAKARAADPTVYAMPPPPSPAYTQFVLPCLLWESDCVARPVPDLALSGDGRTQATPFQITTCAQLQAIQKNLTARYSLGNDIDCTGFDFGDGMGFMPIGSVAEPFTGVLDGMGLSIKGLRIVRSRVDGTGLFGNAVGATVQHLKLARAEIMGSNGVGTLIGNAQRAQVLDCQIDGVLAARQGGSGAVGIADANTKLEQVTDHVVVSNLQ